MLTSQHIETLVSPRLYSADVAAAVPAICPLAVEIANLWMLGWPPQVEALLAAGTYLKALRQQEVTEREVLASTDLRHLTRHELMEVTGLSPALPM